MQWVIPIIAILAAGFFLVRYLVKQARYGKCADCPFADNCPFK